MAYLLCERCNGYYELLPGETPEDYDLCECGGKLLLVNSIYSASHEKPKKTIKRTTFLLAIILTVLLIAGLTYYLLPDSWKMDHAIPNKVGAYEVPSTQKLQSQAGSFYSEPVKVLGNGNSLAKYYLKPNSNVMMIVGIIHTDDVEEIKKMRLMWEGPPEEARIIAGKTFDCYYDGTYKLIFNGNNYIIEIKAVSTSSQEPKNVLQKEALTFAQNFIPEFNKNSFYH